MDYIQEIQEQIEYARSAGDIETQYFLQGELANNLFSKRDYAQAVEVYQNVLKIAEETHNVAGRGTTLSNLGNAHLELGDTKKAKKLYDEALQISREIGDRTLEGKVLNNLGLFNYKIEESEAAERLFQEALKVARETYDAKLESEVLNNIQLIATRLKEPTRLEIPLERKGHKRLITISLVLLSCATFIITLTWISISRSLIPLAWIDGLSVLIGLTSVLGGLAGLAAIMQPPERNFVRQEIRPEVRDGVGS